MTMSKRAERVIEFLSELYGMDRLRTTVATQPPAVIDLLTATVIEVLADDPEGEYVRVEHPLGRISQIETQKLVETLLVRHAQAMAVMTSESGAADEHYRRVREAYFMKTGAQHLPGNSGS